MQRADLVVIHPNVLSPFLDQHPIIFAAVLMCELLKSLQHIQQRQFN